MDSSGTVDIDFDFRLDAHGKDPDSHSQTLKRYHQLLWRKPLPNGKLFNLQVNPSGYLLYETPEKTYYLASDAITNSYMGTKKMGPLRDQLKNGEVEKVFTAGCTIGAYIIFPGNRIERNMTINGARGFNQKIADRFDLTLECIRRHYLALDHPLRKTFNLYGDFFNLFTNFENYVNFFLLQDLVSNDFKKINYFTKLALPFESPGYPKDLADYAGYLTATYEFKSKRNLRIKNWVLENLD